MKGVSTTFFKEELICKSHPAASVVHASQQSTHKHMTNIQNVGWFWEAAAARKANNGPQKEQATEDTV